MRATLALLAAATVLAGCDRSPPDPRPVETEVPAEWRGHDEALFGRPGPKRMGDLPAENLPIWVRPWAMGHNPDNAHDRAVMTTREAVFQHHGLDPWFD